MCRSTIPAERYARVKKRTMDEIEASDVVAACEELLSETRKP